MVAPLIAAGIISAVGSLGSAALGAGASGAASAQAAALNAAQLNSQSRENFLRRVLGDRLLGIQLQGGQDALGNTTRFIPGRGFVTTPSEPVKQVQSASIREQLARLIGDSSIRREGLQTNATRRRADSALAEVLRGRFTRELQSPQVNQNELFQLLLAGGNQAFQQEQDRQLEQVLRQNLRSGGSAASGGDIIARFADRSAAGRRDAATNAKLQSISGAENINNTRLANRGNLFNLLANRASNFQDVAFAPEALSANASSLGAGQRQGVLGASQIAGSLGATQGGRVAGFPGADFGLANAVGGAGDVLSSLIEKFGNQPQSPTPLVGVRLVGNRRVDAAGRVLGSV